MLTQFHKILLAALAVQLALVAFVLTRSDDSAALKEHPILVGLDAAKVTRLRVSSSGPNGKTVDLVKRGDSWVLASGFDYPVAQSKITDVLSPITKAAAAAPIATQASRHKQLRVADDDFERKLVITSDGKDLTLYLGGSAGARRTAVRVGGDDKVFGAAGISTWSIGDEARQWLDTSYVKVAKDDLTKVVVQRDGKTVELTRPAPAPPADAGSGSAAPATPAPAEHWSVTLAGSPITFAAGESLDDAAIDRLIGEVATIDLASPADPKRDASKPTATITLERKASGTTTPAPLVLDVVADGTSYWVRDRALPRAVLVDKARLDDVLAVDRDKLVKKPPPPSPAPGAGSGSAAKAAPAPAPGAPGLAAPGTAPHP